MEVIYAWLCVGLVCWFCWSRYSSGYTTNTVIYVLQCDQQKFYVGRAQIATYRGRIQQHLSGRGSAWTKRYHPQKVVAEYAKASLYVNQLSLDEDKWVLEYMDTYGIDNVRGGQFSNIVLSRRQRHAIQTSLNHARDACLRCGSPDHFISTCPTEDPVCDHCGH
jgi:hypothetical protein